MPDAAAGGSPAVAAGGARRVIAPQTVVCFPMAISGGAPVREEGVGVPPGWPGTQLGDPVRSLHREAARADWTVLLDVTGAGGIGNARGPVEVLKLDAGDAGRRPLESVYCASMAFVGGGPFADLAVVDPEPARVDPRLLSSGRRVGFSLPGVPGSPLYRVSADMWYCWLTLRALSVSSWEDRLADFGGFTEVGARPPEGCRSLAWCCALRESLRERNVLDAAASVPGFLRLWNAWKRWL